MISKLLVLAGVSLLQLAYGSLLESDLRDSLFAGYNKYVRPVEPSNKTLDVTVGMAVQNIESFNQIEETIKLNVWLRKYWKNEFLQWNSSNSLKQITLADTDIWTPDIELLNAATKPDIYTLNGGMYLYSNGEMLWSMPAIYKFSCPLDLHKFPLDVQDCIMRFGSWSYDTELLSLKPHGSDSTQIDVLDSFSHSEWELLDYYVVNQNETRACCGEKRFDINEYHFKLRRFTHYYKLNMGMTIALVIVSFIIMLIKPDNLSRTGTAVFIPLTILALQLTIADKIPIVGYYTLMDQFFLTCFITSMVVSIESGIVFTLITSKTRLIFKVFDSIINYNNLLLRLRNDLIKSKNRNNEHLQFIISKKKVICPVINIDDCNDGYDCNDGNDCNDCNDSKHLQMTVLDKYSSNNEINSANKEFNKLENILLDIHYNDNDDNDDNNTQSAGSTLQNRTNSYSEGVGSSLKLRKNTIKSSNNHDGTTTHTDTVNNEFIHNNNTIDRNITKTVSFDNIILDLTYKEHIIFNEVSRIFIKMDNIFRVVLPLIYFIIIIVIFSNES